VRKALRAMLVAVLTFLSAVAVGYKENARDRFIAPANPSCTASNGCVLVGIRWRLITRW
jgi:hypothetical protein